MIEKVLSILFFFVLVLSTVSNAGIITVDNYPAGNAATGIGASRHNLGVFGRVIRTSSSTEICIFCHTPHHSNTSSGPLWNRSSPVAALTAYGLTSAGSNIAAINGPSLACLSCHDGVTTFDNIVNTPGKGGVVAGGTDRNFGFNMPLNSSYPGQENILLDGFHTGPSQICSLCHNPNTAFTLDYVSSMNIGTDLTNDHPVSVTYNEALPTGGLRPRNTVISTIDLISELSSSADPDLLNNMAQNRWAVNGFISDTATVADLLRDGKVECTSCHDPHFSNKSWDEVDITYKQPTPSIDQFWNITPGWCGGYGPNPAPEDCSDGLFLRRVGGNTGSGVCRTCHEK